MLLQVPHYAKFSKGSYTFLAVCSTSLTEDDDDENEKMMVMTMMMMMMMNSNER